MAAAAYYDTADTADTQVEKTKLSPSRGPQITGMHPEGSTQDVGQELHQSGGEQRGFPQQGYNEQVQHGMPQQASNEQYPQQGSYGQNSGVHGGQQQQMGNNNNNNNNNYTQGGGQQQQMGQQQMGNNNYTQNGGQQMNSNGEQAAVADDRDTMTKWLDRIEKKFGGERFNNPENAEKNRRMNQNILKRVKQVGMLVVQRAPRMLMNMGR